jgi:putative transcriptional regulator
MFAGRDVQTALGISVHTLRNWEQDRRKPDGPALALLRVVVRHPQVLKELLTSQAARTK